MVNLKKNILPIVIFLTGACVLVVEVVATRILSPYYGNTIFTVSSVISIVLAALSAGYYVGGKSADKNPSEKAFYSIILLSGLSVMLLQVLTQMFLPSLGYSLPTTTGPIISSLLLFFIPSFLLGMLSPYAIKLQVKNFPDEGIGSISGGVFFWSTLGSIFGSLLAGFVLIPHFGVSQITISVAVLLVVVGLVPLVLMGVFKERINKTKIFFVISLLLGSLLLSYRVYGSDVLYVHDGIYERLSVYNGNLNGHPARFFTQDRSSSGAMYLDSDELPFKYTKYYSLYKVFKPDLKNVLVIGGGVYSIPKVLLQELPDVRVDVSEIEPSLYDLAKKYFNVVESDRLVNYTDDGRRLLNDTDKKYDMIFSDVYYSLFSVPAHFTTKEFFDIAKSRLSQDGVFVANLIGDLSRQDESLIMSEIKTFQTVFPNSYFFAVEKPDKIDSQNIIFVGWNSDKRIDFKSKKITNEKDQTIQTLGSKAIDLSRFELSAYPILTDDFAPVEYLTSKVLENELKPIKSIDGDEMLNVIKQQLRYGPRYLSAPGHASMQKFLVSEMSAFVPEVKLQTWQHVSTDGKKIGLTNIIGRLKPENKKRIILATHYDSKKTADKDSFRKGEPVPGANDSASGVAVLLELAKTFANANKLPGVGVDFVFFDGEEGEEDQGDDFTNWKPLGSTYFAEHLNDIYGENKPMGAVVLDMICDKHLNITKERTSLENASAQTLSFWEIARRVDSSAFEDKVGLGVSDDHTPLNRVGVPSFLVIDFDYPYYHTVNDTTDKCSPESLETVATAVQNYVYAQR
ncbi:fused MFS/spermidine synthase [Candidatus Falkowbacteria bacterium]|nr:fused MFS/spermidine synthase [Candidatus Falkowbacteria bacterium]